MDLEIFSEHPPSEQRSSDLIAQIEAYNLKQQPLFNPEYRHFGFFIRDLEGGEPQGGVVGWTWLGSLHIHRIFVDARLRNQGYGSKLLEKTEDLARSENCSLITVETLSFQRALAFYLKHGFKVVFEDEGYSLGVSVSFLRKRLAEPRI